MKSPHPPELDEEILTQAADWCMRLHDESCTAEDRLAFQEWVQSDPGHAFEYARMLEIWDLSGELPNHQGTAKNLLADPSTAHHGVLKM